MVFRPSIKRKCCSARFHQGNLAPNMSSAAKKILVTGSSGLIGSEAVEHFDRQGHQVIGIDNNMRRVFFGEQGDTTWNLERQKTRVAYCCQCQSPDVPGGQN